MLEQEVPWLLCRGSLFLLLRSSGQGTTEDRVKSPPTSKLDRPPLAGPTYVSSRRLLTESEAAAYLRVSRSFLAKKRCSGGGPRFCKIGRRVLYDITDLDEFTEQGKRRSTSESPAA